MCGTRARYTDTQAATHPSARSTESIPPQYNRERSHGPVKAVRKKKDTAADTGFFGAKGLGERRAEHTWHLTREAMLQERRTLPKVNLIRGFLVLVSRSWGKALPVRKCGIVAPYRKHYPQVRGVCVSCCVVGYHYKYNYDMIHCREHRRQRHTSASKQTTSQTTSNRRNIPTAVFAL